MRRARQVVDRCMCERYGRRGAIYLRQARWADSMRDHTNGICLTYGVGSRVLSVIGCMPWYLGSRLFGLFGDGAELGKTCQHDKRVLRVMF